VQLIVIALRVDAHLWGTWTDTQQFVIHVRGDATAELSVSALYLLIFHAMSVDNSSRRFGGPWWPLSSSS